MFQVTDAWRAAFPGAAAGMLLMRGVTNPPLSSALREHAGKVERELRERFGVGEAVELTVVPVLQAYRRYYKAFGQNYHVQLQLESVLKGKPLAAGAALVEAMFAAEVKNLLLTAGHDFGALRMPVTVDVSSGGEEYEVFSGRVKVLKPGDMFMRDCAGVISSVLYGPDRRTSLRPETRDVLFAVYTPAGVGASAVRAHLDDIAANVRLIAPEALVEAVEVREA